LRIRYVHCETEAGIVVAAYILGALTLRISHGIEPSVILKRHSQRGEYKNRLCSATIIVSEGLLLLKKSLAGMNKYPWHSKTTNTNVRSFSIVSMLYSRSIQ